jgi:UDPglucose 6-dehydrogenase
MKIAVIGTGYVGLVAGACLAETGNDVVCFDRDKAKISELRHGRIPIYEPGLEELVRRNRLKNRLSFTSTLLRAVKSSNVIFVAVSTPQAEDGSADLQHVFSAVKDLSRLIDEYKVIVIKSTVPPGTSIEVQKLVKHETTCQFSVVSNPEFLKQGSAIEDFMKPDRIVVGTEDSRAVDIMLELYSPFTKTGAPILVMDCASAELSKYAANAMLATRISFINEVANFCELVGADIDQLRRAIASDKRIGGSFLFPGVGFGGSCLSKDVKALTYAGSEEAYDFKLLRAVDVVNSLQKKQLFSKMKTCFGSLENKAIGVWGLAFKPGTDDMREAPAIPLINDLLSHGAEVQVYDPVAMRVARSIFGSKIIYASRSYDALKGVDALAIVTEWNEFRGADFVRMRKLMRSPVIFDGRNIFTIEQMKTHGFKYYSIGR